MDEDLLVSVLAQTPSTKCGHPSLQRGDGPVYPEWPGRSLSICSVHTCLHRLTFFTIQKVSFSTVNPRAFPNPVGSDEPLQI
mmetsp:Transcript_17306/g.35139  ORF Transcript_17306/g.35139 Transcript_17306/m.35139 type:complete len:82 (-) Transcript_17306:1075-1320(-)